MIYDTLAGYRVKEGIYTHTFACFFHHLQPWPFRFFLSYADRVGDFDQTSGIGSWSELLS